MSYEAFISAYIEIDENIKLKNVKNIKCCPNIHCEKYKKEMYKVSFCSSCGSKIDELEIECEPETPSANDFGLTYFDDEDLLYYWNYNPNFWFFNFKIENKSEQLKFDIKEENHLVLSEFNFEAELEKYKHNKKVQKILSKIEELYGKNSAVLKIGLFPDYD